MRTPLACWDSCTPVGNSQNGVRYEYGTSHPTEGVAMSENGEKKPHDHESDPAHTPGDGWVGEGGASHLGPATHVGALDDDDAAADDEEE